MVAENMKNGWELILRALELFTKQPHHTAQTRTGSQKGQIEQSWRESRLLLQKQSSTKGYGWKLWIQLCISRITVQQVQSQLHLTSSGTASNPTSHISELSDRQRTSIFQRKNGRSSIPIHTRESWSAMEAQISTRYGI